VMESALLPSSAPLESQPLKSQPIEAIVLAAALSGLSKNTCRVYSTHLTEFLFYLHAHESALSRLSVEQYIASREFALSSFNQMLSAIKRLAMQAAQHGWIAYPVAVQIDALRTRTQRGTKAGNWLTLDQARALLNAPDGTIRGKRDKAVLALLLGCGLRRVELAKLAWDQLKQRDSRWMLIDIKGKGGRIRTIAVPDWVYTALDAWGTIAFRYHAAWAERSGFVVRSIREDGTINGSLSASGVWDIVLHYASLTGVVCTPHDLRRTFAKLARKNGAPLDVIQKSLGHSSVRTTEIYTSSGEEANAGDYFKL
jgi:site-specific recombinase XerD